MPTDGPSREASLPPIWVAPLGVPTAIRTDDAGLWAAAAHAYADWRTAAPASGAVIEVRLEAGIARGDGLPPRVEVEGLRLTLAGAGLAGEADARSKRARARVPQELAGRPDVLAAEVLDTLLLFLLARSDRTPVHAAGVLLGPAALVLAGPSGSGKSTLTLAAMGRGLQILSDDTVYIQLRPSTRVWGFRRPLHVFPEDAPRFTQGVRLRAGKLKAVVPVAPEAAGAAFADRAVLILLERGDEIALTAMEPQAALGRLAALEPGFDLLARQSAAAAAALAGQGAWRLTLGRDPRAAIDLLFDRLGPAGR